MAFLDEMGSSKVVPIKSTWARRGQTPSVRTAIDHYERLNVIGAMLISPAGRQIRLKIQTTEKKVNGKTVVRFLRALLKQVAGPILLVWDNAKFHTQGAAKRFLQANPRIHVIWLPKYAPELNPVEQLWAQVKEHLASKLILTPALLRAEVHAALQRARASRKRLEACLIGCQLPWNRRSSRCLFKAQ